MHIPEPYQNFYRHTKVKEFDTTHPTALYLILDDIDHLDELNDLFQLSSVLPDYYAFGTDGGNEIYAFNKHGVVFMIPMIGMSSDTVIKIADSWDEFEKFLKFCPTR